MWTSIPSPCTLRNASLLTVALHMKRFDVAQYFFIEHSLCPVFCGSRDYPPVFLEYMEYGTFNFIPWVMAEGYYLKEGVRSFIEKVVSTDVLMADGMKEAERRTGRNVVHALLLCDNHKGVGYFKDKRPDLIQVVIVILELSDISLDMVVIDVFS